MEVWDVIVLGDGPAGLQAAAEAAAAGASVLQVTAGALGGRDASMLDGLAAALGEDTNRGHREDTIRAGAFLADQDVVASATASAVREVDLLERRGVVFRRDARGLPATHRLPGHGRPRVTGAGDADSREVQQVLEEQGMRHGVVRRGDQLPLRLVHANQRVQGLVVADLVGGRVLGLQCKALILADGGAVGALIDGRGGLGLDLALQAGLPLRDMEFVASSPLGLKDTGMVLPMSLLASGAVLCEADGTPLELGDDLSSAVRAVRTAASPVLDMRNMGASRPWYDATFRLIKQRTGVDADVQTVAVEARPLSVLGGVAVDEQGRAVLGVWSRWFTGLWAAGDAACTGMHGAALLPGNLGLDALVSGRSAGESAGAWVKDAASGGAAMIAAAVEEAEADLAAMFTATPGEDGAVRTGLVGGEVAGLMRATLDDGCTSESLEAAMTALDALEVASEALHLDDTSLVANTNLVDVLELQAGVRQARAILLSAMSRTESRGSHVRHDHAEADPEQLHHTLVSADGTTGRLALRKGASGHWVLSPP